MATRVETNVTIASIIVVRPSTRNSIGTCRLPASSQSKTTVVASGPAETQQAERARGTPGAIPATTGQVRLLLEPAARRPPRSGRPSSGKNGTSQAFRTKNPGTSAGSRSSSRRSRRRPRSTRRYDSVAAHGPGRRAGAAARRRRGSGAGTSRGRRPPRPARPRRPGRRASAGWPGSRMSCQSVTSSDDRRLNRIRIKARAIDASHAATVRITIVKTWPGPVAVVAAEPDERQRRPLEHHLGREEHHDQVPPGEEPEHPERHQRGADEQVVPQDVERETSGMAELASSRVGRRRSDVRRGRRRGRGRDGRRGPRRRSAGSAASGVAIARAPIRATNRRAPASSTVTRWSV